MPSAPNAAVLRDRGGTACSDNCAVGDCGRICGTRLRHGLGRIFNSAFDRVMRLIDTSERESRSSSRGEFLNGSSRGILALLDARLQRLP